LLIPVKKIRYNLNLKLKERGKYFCLLHVTSSLGRPGGKARQARPGVTGSTPASLYLIFLGTFSPAKIQKVYHSAKTSFEPATTSETTTLASTPYH
jgi:hypothetical protein